MTDEEEPIVLRSIYLPQRIDNLVASIAFSRGLTKREVITGLIIDGLERFEESGEKTLAQRIDAVAKTHGV